MKKKNFIILILILILILYLGGYLLVRKNKYSSLPKPELTGGERGKLGIDKNINEKTLDNYLERTDTIYRDVRMIDDPADWSKIVQDGDKITGIVKGFSVIPYPYLVSFTDEYKANLNKQFGFTEFYSGPSLYKDNGDGTYTANYKESLSILQYYFPKNKNIFLMCGGGGYAGKTKELLIALGWDKNKIYDVGGYWYYNGKNKIDILEKVNGKKTYNFWKIPTYNIDFNSLTRNFV